MITAIVLFFSALALFSSIFGAFFASSQAIYAVCVLGIFGSIALGIVTKKGIFWAVMFICCLIMVAVEQLAPYQGALSYLFALTFSLIVTVVIKQHLWRMVRNDQNRTGGPRMRPWMHIVLRWA